MAAEVITRTYNVTSKQLLTYVSSTQGLETRGEREHEKLFSSPSMKTTLGNKIKNTRRKSGNKWYNGRCVTISKTCHEEKWPIPITL